MASLSSESEHIGLEISPSAGLLCKPPVAATCRRSQNPPNRVSTGDYTTSISTGRVRLIPPGNVDRGWTVDTDWNLKNNQAKLIKVVRELSLK